MTPTMYHGQDYSKCVPLHGRLAFGGVTAIGLHYGLFVHQEWHLQSPMIFTVHLLALILYTAFLIKIEGCNITSSFLEALLLFSGYLTTLLTSIAVYRLYFHRLSRAGFPGPRLARTTKIWHAWACRDSRNFLVLDELARQYGDFVRTGPSELTITHPDVYQAIDGLGSVCGKADWYDITHPNISLVTARDSKTHDNRRRTWDQGFSTKAVVRYKERALKYVRMLEEHIATDVAAGRSTAVGTLFSWFGFDVMGDFVFGNSFNMLQNREWHSVILRLREALALLGPLTPVPWLVHFGFNVAGILPLIKNWFAMIAWCRQQMENRAKLIIENDNSEPDVSYWLIEDARRNGFTETDWNWLSGDAVLAIVAGSDTVTSTLICLFYRLASDPVRTEKLHAEVAAIDCSDDKTLQKLPYLNGVVNEALRLHPALPTGGYRKTPKEGAIICGRFVPGETTIIAPRYTIFRREDCFENAESFIPERWCEIPEMVRNKKGFMPFGTGRYSCIGRNLGLAELRLVTATLVKKYSISFGHEKRPLSFLNGIQDCFVARTGPLELQFRARRVAKVD